MTSLRAQMLGIAFGLGAAAVLAATPALVGSRDPHRCRHRQGAARGKRHLSVVPGFRHQTDDALHDPARDQGRPHHLRHAAHGFAQRHLQAPTKMGLPVGTQVTVDNALKMLMVKSANDMAVVIAEGVGGSIDGFADMMNANARRLGMTQSNFVNPNGLPADNHVTSARDLGILARALIHEFPDYNFYWHIPSIRYGNRIMHNYNSLLDRYPGADGMKTGFICASGYNVVASATRNGRRLIAIVLGALPARCARRRRRNCSSADSTAIRCPGSRPRSAPSTRWRRSTRSRPTCRKDVRQASQAAGGGRRRHGRRQRQSPGGRCRKRDPFAAVVGAAGADQSGPAVRSRSGDAGRGLYRADTKTLTSRSPAHCGRGCA